jgi:hypothetical protein
MAMMRPQNYEQRAGLYMLEPYDPDRIPVIFVHGLIGFSLPARSDVDSLRAHYQIAHPTYRPTKRYQKLDPLALSRHRIQAHSPEAFMLAGLEVIFVADRRKLALDLERLPAHARLRTSALNPVRSSWIGSNRCFCG